MRCPYCSGTVIYDSEVGCVCTSCGTVVDDRPIDPSPRRGDTVTYGFTYTIHSKGVGFTAPVNRTDSRIKFECMGRLGLVLSAMFRYYKDYLGDKCVVNEASMIAHKVLRGTGRLSLSDIDLAGVLIYIASRRCGKTMSMKTLPSGLSLFKALRTALETVQGLRGYYLPGRPVEEALAHVERATKCLDYENPGEVVKLSREILESMPLPHATPRMLAGVVIYLSLMRLNASPSYRKVSDCVGVRDMNLSLNVRKAMKEIPVIF